MPQVRKKKDFDKKRVEFDSKTPAFVKNDRAKREAARKRKKRNRIIIRVVVILVCCLLIACVGGYAYLYSTDAFKIEHVQVNGVKHLTDDEINQLINIPEDATLLKVDSETIEKRLKRDAWIQDVSIIPSFPDTLTINITERPITAIVEVPISSAEKTYRNWAISADHM